MATYRATFLLAAALLVVPSFAQAVGPELAAAVADHARCALEATQTLEGFDKCETWTARDTGSLQGPEDPTGIAVSPTDGTIFITGVIETPNVGVETVAHDPATGEALWSSVTFREGLSWGDHAVVSQDGSRLFVLGQSTVPGHPYDMLLLAYDATTGDIVWETTYNSASDGADYQAGVVALPDGRVVVAGSSPGPTSRDIVAIAFDGATGAREWEARYDGATQADDSSFAIAASPDGARVFITGYVARTAFPFVDVVTLAVDTATGEQAWVATYAGPRGIASGAAIAVSPDGSTVFVTGDQNDGGRLEYVTLAYDAADGTFRWASTYASAPGLSSVPLAIAVSPDSSRVFVTGESAGFDSFADDALDFATAGYDATTGAELWVARYDGPAHSRDNAVGLVVARDGERVYVTGTSDTGPVETAPQGPWWDFATLAYDASSGATAWEARYNGPLSAGDTPWALALSPAGDALYVTGSTQGVGGTDYLTVAYAIE